MVTNIATAQAPLRYLAKIKLRSGREIAEMKAGNYG